MPPDFRAEVHASEVYLACPQLMRHKGRTIAVSKSPKIEEFAERLLVEEKVAVVPGSAFGQGGKGYVRCCYATSLQEIEEALVRMKRFVDKYK